MQINFHIFNVVKGLSDAPDESSIAYTEHYKYSLFLIEFIGD